MEALASPLQQALKDKRLSTLRDLIIATDRLDYPYIDQVFPLFAEQEFFVDEMRTDKIRGASVLEIGLGSGVLSIAAARAGAKQVTALEINPRARNFAGFNIVLNQVADRISILTGDSQIYAPVCGRRFDYILSNPPFEPTPPGMEHFYHSAAGHYGMDFLDALFQGFDAHLSDKGHAQIVTGAHGDVRGPALLIDLIEQRLHGQTTVIVSPRAVTFDAIMDRMVAQKPAAAAQVDALRQRATRDGVTHMHLCVIHYEPGPKMLQVRTSNRPYDPDAPLTEFAPDNARGVQPGLARAVL